MLPIPDRPAHGLTTYDAKDPETAFPPIDPLLPPQGAPNVLIVLLDDVGFGASSAFGGPCRTPTADRLAAGGLRFNRFHTTALCAPTRQAMLTGRNHHSVGMGSITETATSAPGNSSLRPNTKAPLAMTLKLNGYATAQFGKCHEVPVWQSSPLGPFDGWPSGGVGFETFYGFIGGENNQWEPALYDGTTPIEPPATAEEGYHLTEDLTDRAVNWIRQQKALMPDKPFFAYFAPGATHAPHHVPKEWADRYAGAFDDGWDAQRDRTFARQKELGVIPDDAQLTTRHAEITAWDDMPDELKPVLAREMEVYAGFLEHTDHHVGRLIDTLEDLEILDDTIVYYIIGDNGASAEGTLNGAFNEAANFNGMAALETPEFMVSKMDEFGSPSSYNHYAVGGRGRWTPPSSGPSRSRPTGAAPATAPSCTGPTASRSAADCAPSSPTSSTWRPPSSRRQASPNRRWSTASCSRRWKARACCTRSTTRTPRNATTCSTSRCSPTAASTTKVGAR
jgi:arylsulfatase